MEQQNNNKNFHINEDSETQDENELKKFNLKNINF